MRELPPVAILAGGLAKRLRPITESTPKALVEVAGRPFIAHQLEQLRVEGVRRVVCCVGYKGEMIEEAVGDGSGFGLRVSYSYDGDKLLGTGGAVKRALGMLGSDFFVLYGDSYLQVNYRDVKACHDCSGKLGVMTIYENEGKWDTSNVHYRDGRIIVYSKKNRSPEMTCIDYGLGLLKAEAFDGYPEDEPFDLAAVYEKLAAEGELAGFVAAKRFYEIGSKSGLRELEDLIGRSAGHCDGISNHGG